MNCKTRRIITYFSFIVIFFLFFTHNLLQAQIRSDFLITESGLRPCIALDKQGRLHTAWQDKGNIYYRLFDSSGYPITEFLLIADKGVNRYPKLAANSQHVVMVWDIDYAGIEPGIIKGQLLTIDGTPIFDYITFPDIYSLHNPATCFLNDSTFVVVSTYDKIYGHIATTSLRFIRQKIDLNDYEISLSSSTYARVAGNTENENFMVAWLDDHLGFYQIFGRVLQPDGTPVCPSFLISDDPDLTELFSYDAAVAPNGDFAVVWSGVKDTVSQIQWRWFNNEGEQIRPTEPAIPIVDKELGSHNVKITVDSDGKCVVAWQQLEFEYIDIFAQRFLPDRTPVGDRFRIPMVSDTAYNGLFSVDMRNGRIYTAWTQFIGGDSTCIKANIIDFDDPPSHTEQDRLQQIPENFRLFQNLPNPFNAQTIISYSLPAKGQVRLTIHNILGKEVIKLVDEVQSPGLHKITWNGKDSKGGDAPSGIYLYNLRWRGEIQRTAKMILNR